MEPKARGALGSHRGPPVLAEVSKGFCRTLWWDKELATGTATVTRGAFQARSHFLSHLSETRSQQQPELALDVALPTTAKR